MIKIAALFIQSFFSFDGGIKSVTNAIRDVKVAQLESENSTNVLVADIEINRLQQQLKMLENAKEIRMSTASYPEMRVLTFFIVASLTLHLVYVVLDSIYQYDWDVAALPAPFDEYQGAILLSFFGLKTAQSAINGTIALMLRKQNG